MTRTPARRTGFTLIELLVVISIITVLSALTVGVFTRVRASNMKSTTDATLTKINSLIDRRWSAVLAQVEDDVKKNHPVYASVLGTVQNQDLAKALYTHAKMKNEFPMCFNEARNPTLIQVGPAASPTTIASIPPKAAFTTLPAGAAGGTPEESAACLYLAVTVNAGGGTATDTDGVQQQAGTTSGGQRCFKDAWGTPIAFVRAAYAGEVNDQPFVRAGQRFDPFDPRGKLTAFATANPAWWSVPNNTSGMRPLGTWTAPPSATVNWAGAPATYPGATNFVPTAISAGPNRNFGADVYGLAPGDTDPGKDNQLSYRLRREGARGD